MSYWFDWVVENERAATVETVRMAHYAAKQLKTSIPDLIGSRKRAHVYRKMVIIEYLLDHGKTLKEISKLFEYKDHTTVWHLSKQVKNLAYTPEIKLLKQMLYG